MRGSRARLRYCITLCDFATLRETCFFSREGAKPRRNEAAGCGEVEQDSDIALLFVTSRICVRHALSDAKRQSRRFNEAAEFPCVMQNHTWSRLIFTGSESRFARETGTLLSKVWQFVKIDFRRSRLICIFRVKSREM